VLGILGMGVEEAPFSDDGNIGMLPGLCRSPVSYLGGVGDESYRSCGCWWKIEVEENINLL
jgi:hypothetical protein